MVDAFAVKFDASGQAVWSERFGYDAGPYCLPGGRYFANCTAGGWDVGYAQLLCQ
jgi:hypothetical protein